MAMKLGVTKTEHGWELTYDDCLAPEEEAVVFKTKAEALRECEHQEAQSRAWDRRGEADAPHLDNF